MCLNSIKSRFRESMNPFMNINNVLSDRQFSHQKLSECFFHGSDIEICDL